MPLFLPHEGVSFRAHHTAIYVQGTHTKMEVIKGGLRLVRNLHYLWKVENGLCHFAPTKDNSHYKEGLLIIASLIDIDTPKDFKQRVVSMYRDGWLTADDLTIHPWYAEDSINAPRI